VTSWHLTSQQIQVVLSAELVFSMRYAGWRHSGCSGAQYALNTG